jgi:hypothetical protein
MPSWFEWLTLSNQPVRNSADSRIGVHSSDNTNVPFARIVDRLQRVVSIHQSARKFCDVAPRIRGSILQVERALEKT